MKLSPVRALSSAAVLCGVATMMVAPPPPASGRGRAVATASVRVAAAGDIAHANSPNTHQRQTADLITSVIHPNEVLMLGDGQYEHGEYNQYMRSYDPTWGAFKHITAPVPGNHEYETPHASGYFQYFAGQLNGRGSSATDWQKGYYSFNLGDWHIVALNSNCNAVNCGAEATWLKNDVANDGHLCELAMWHDPGRGHLGSAAAAAKVDVILAGHHHLYERWDHRYGNTRLFIVGTGGRSSGPPNPRADAKYRGYGVLQLDLAASGYSWKFLEAGTGHTKDSGSGTCHD
jgi:acid phosphatase type 7